MLSFRSSHKLNENQIGVLLNCLCWEKLVS